MARQKKIKAVEYIPSYLEINSMWWCINNNIIIYPKVSGDEYYLIVQVGKGKNKNIIKSPDTYHKFQYMEKMYELYKSIFLDRNESEFIEKSKENILKS